MSVHCDRVWANYYSQLKSIIYGTVLQLWFCFIWDFYSIQSKLIHILLKNTLPNKCQMNFSCACVFMTSDSSLAPVGPDICIYKRQTETETSTILLWPGWLKTSTDMVNGTTDAVQSTVCFIIHTKLCLLDTNERIFSPFLCNWTHIESVLNWN